MQVRWRRRALRDLNRIRQYIAAEDPQAAQSVARRIDECADQLEVVPRIGRPWPRKKGVRRLVVSGLPYLIYYRVLAHEAEILHVRDGRRRPPQPDELPR